MKKENTFIPKNKKQANEIYNLFNNISSVTNLLKLSPEIGIDNEMLDGANTINSITEAYNNALKKKYNLENNSFIINNPVDEIQQNISKVMVKGALSAANNIYQEGKKAIQWGKDVKNDFPKLLLTYKYGIARCNLMLYNKKISRKIFYEKKVINYIWNTNFSFYNFAHNTNC